MWDPRRIEQTIGSLTDGVRRLAGLLFEEQRTDYELSVRRVTFDAQHINQWIPILEDNPRRVRIRVKIIGPIAGGPANVFLNPRPAPISTGAPVATDYTGIQLLSAVAATGAPSEVYEERKPYIYCGRWHAFTDFPTLNLEVCEWSRPTQEDRRGEG